MRIDRARPSWATVFFALAVTACAQDKGDGIAVPDAEERVVACEARLKEGESAQEILLDPALDDLHAVTTFRKLIEEHAPIGQVAIAKADEPGEFITVHCKVTSSNGKPAGNALVYAYHTDARGWYAACCPHVLINSGDYDHARLFAYVRTRADGTFDLHTIMPKGYPNSDLAAHIHVHVNKGNESAGTEFLFADDPRMTRELLMRSGQGGYPVAERTKGRNGPEYHYTITID